MLLLHLLGVLRELLWHVLLWYLFGKLLRRILWESLRGLRRKRLLWHLLGILLRELM